MGLFLGFMMAMVLMAWEVILHICSVSVGLIVFFICLIKKYRHNENIPPKMKRAKKIVLIISAVVIAAFTVFVVVSAAVITHNGYEYISQQFRDYHP